MVNKNDVKLKYAVHKATLPNERIPYITSLIYYAFMFISLVKLTR